MRVREKINMDKMGLVKNGPITIVAFGDSVTHGALGNGIINYETVYWNLLKRKLNAVRNYVPVNVINAGIGGITAIDSLDRMDAQVLAHNPDLVIVAFGLNDVNRPLEQYTGALRTIFERLRERDIETVLLTPNMLNTYVAEDTAPELKAYAAVTADYQTSGRMDEYMAAAVKTANECGVLVADVYSMWRELSKTTDTTLLLDNRINHPAAKMHELFADELFCVIMAEDGTRVEKTESTMYNSDN